MQNKPNFSNNKMDINFYLTNYYEQKTPLKLPAKQSQSNPIKAKQSQFQTQLNPNRPNFKASVSAGWHCQTPAYSIMSTASLKHLTQSGRRIKLMANIF
jgi:hypothetical protein